MYCEALPKMVSFHPLRYGSLGIKEGRVAHLYAGAMRRGRSERRLVGEGFEGWNGSSGHAWALLEVETKVGVANAALDVNDG